MAKKPIQRSDESEERVHIKTTIHKLRPVAGDVLIFSDVPPMMDSETLQALSEEMVNRGIIPDGVGMLFVPDGVEVGEMPEEAFNSLGYYRVGDEDEEEE